LPQLAEFEVAIGDLVEDEIVQYIFRAIRLHLEMVFDYKKYGVYVTYAKSKLEISCKKNAISILIEYSRLF
jgi:hypothetical protein